MRTNSAINLYAALGVHLNYEKASRNLSRTKAGPGRAHNGSKWVKTAEQKRAGAYGRGLRNEITRKNAKKLAQKGARHV